MQTVKLVQVKHGLWQLAHIRLVIFPYVPLGQAFDKTQFVPVKYKTEGRLFRQLKQLFGSPVQVAQFDVHFTQIEFTIKYPTLHELKQFPFYK